MFGLTQWHRQRFPTSVSLMCVGGYSGTSLGPRAAYAKPLTYEALLNLPSTRSQSHRYRTKDEHGTRQHQRLDFLGSPKTHLFHMAWSGCSHLKWKSVSRQHNLGMLPSYQSSNSLQSMRNDHCIDPAAPHLQMSPSGLFMPAWPLQVRASARDSIKIRRPWLFQ